MPVTATSSGRGYAHSTSGDAGRRAALSSGGTALSARSRRRRWGRGKVRQGRPYLGPDAEVRVGDELGPLALVLRLQVAVQHAHGHAGQGHDEAQRPPQPGCGHRAAQARPRGHRDPSQGQRPPARGPLPSAAPVPSPLPPPASCAAAAMPRPGAELRAWAARSSRDPLPSAAIFLLR